MRVRTCMVVIAGVASLGACTPGHPAPSVSRTTLRVPPSVATTPSAAPTGSPAPSSLIDPRRICRELSAGRSVHDVVGELAGQLGSASRAQQVVDAARAKQCR